MVTMTSVNSVAAVDSDDVGSSNSNNNGNVLMLRGLPFSTIVADVIEFVGRASVVVQDDQVIYCVISSVCG